MPSKSKTVRQKALYSMDETVRCVCGQHKNDDLPMVACDECNVWQHTECTGYKEDNEDGTYLCEKCRPNRHSYLQCGYKTHKEFLKAKKQQTPTQTPFGMEHVNGRRMVRSQPNAELENAYEPPHTRPNGNKKLTQTSAETNNQQQNKCPKRRLSFSTSGEEDRGIKQKDVSSSLSTSQRNRKTPIKKKQKQSRHGSSSDVDAMSETEDCFEGSDVQVEEKASLPISMEVQERESTLEEREKEMKRPKPKRTSSKSAAILPENMTIEQMLERVRRMAQYVTSIEIEHARKNGSVTDEEENRKTTKSTLKKPRTTSATILVTPSPSDHATSPESFAASSPRDCDGVTTPSTESSDKDPTLIDLCEDLMREIIRFEQTYGEQPAEAKKTLKI